MFQLKNSYYNEFSLEQRFSTGGPKKPTFFNATQLEQHHETRKLFIFSSIKSRNEMNDYSKSVK
jgi:hypothetical protein